MKSAVDIAFEELNKWRIKNFGEDALIGIPQEVLDKAKQVEKKQILNALSINETELLCWGITAEKYYKLNYDNNDSNP